MSLTKEEAQKIEVALIKKGYIRYDSQKWKNADYIFWKSFENTFDEYGNKEVGYQVGFAFYDYSKHNIFFENLTGIAYEFLIGESSIKYSRMDITITDSKTTVDEFEKFCEDFYQSEFLKKYKK
jgi:hypothetical protein